jgi:methyl-accepting chemotaxis protein
MNGNGFMRGGSIGGSPELVLKALDKALAIIEFDTRGKILVANQNFCRALGYELDDLIGRNHSMFVDSEFVRSPEYEAFWAALSRGEFRTGEFRRVAKGGRDVWIQASYSPIVGAGGRVTKVVQVAADITAEKQRGVEFEGKVNAISRAQCVAEFKPTGDIITANENFLKALGYRLDEIVGRNHRMFVDPAWASSSEYEQSWRTLQAGEFVAGEFKRIGKGGKEVWIQASYNPVYDAHGQVIKVVEFATDITARAQVLNEVTLGLAELGRNNLEYRITTELATSHRKLKADFNGAMEQLQDVMKVIASNAQGMRGGAGEISQAADDLSRRTEQQAATLEQTAAAMDEITATVKKTAEGAAQANTVVAQAKTDAEKGGSVVREAISAMDQIEQSSHKIGQIIGVIDEIAFQTNLLALNAGVEAARAGDAGRGFAVVASEVRALAQRSAEAAKEIKALISASSQQVKQGVDLVGQTGGALDRIISGVGEIKGLVSDIAASAQEQATGLSQVNTAINHMDQTTQQNAAMVEQSTAASHGLAQEAEELVRMMGRFHTGAEAVHAPQTARAAPAAKAPMRSRHSAPALRTTTSARLAEPQDVWDEF